MIMQRLHLSLVVCSIALIIGVVQFQLVASSGNQKVSYLIKGKPVGNKPSAIVQARRFLSRSLDKKDRCERLAVVLRLVGSRPLDDFQVADIALAKPQYIKDQYAKIDIESLRFLYMDAIIEFKKNQIVDDGLVELADCLADKFRNVDAKVHAFLNEPELKLVLDQYKQIKIQPLRLLSGDQKHPTLLRSDLAPEIRATVTRWNAGDQAKADSMFSDGREVAEPTELITEAPKTSTTSSTTTTSTTTTTTPPPPPFAAFAYASAGSVSQVQTAPSTNVSFGSVGPMIPAALHPANNQPQVYAAEIPVEHQAPEEDVELDEEDKRYLNQLAKTIGSLYETLPVETSLPDRCEAYANVLQADVDHLFSDTYVEQISKDMEDKLKTTGPSRQAYEPDKQIRDDFLMTVRAFEPKQLHDEVWLDVYDCVKVWPDEDEQEAVSFIRHLVEEIDQAAQAAAVDEQAIVSQS